MQVPEFGKVVFLTPEDRLLLDPSGKGGAKVRSYKETSTMPPPSFVSKHPKEMLSLYQSLRSNVLKSFPGVAEWDAQWDVKYGGQGGSFSFETLMSSYEQSYRLAERRILIGKLCYGRDYLLRLIKQTVGRVGYPQLYLDYLERGTDGTLGALPTWLPKGSYHSETMDAKPWRHAHPVVPGERRQRGKNRAINFTATTDIRYVEKILSGVRGWLREWLPELFGAWLNPALEVAPTITQCVRKRWWSSETDFDGCDAHFGWDLIAEAVLPIYEVLLPPAVFWKFAAFIEECYTQPLYCGDFLVTGKHNSFSGEAHVSDFETIYGIELALSAVFCNGISYGAYHIFAMGDDLSVLMKTSERKARAVMDTTIDIAGLNGMDMSVQKCTLTRGNARFTKRYYEPGLPVAWNVRGQEYILGAYPGVLTLNTAMNPERPHKEVSQEILADVQRFDNLYGSPMWAPAVQLFFSRTSKEVRQTLLENPSASIWDWWSKLYGEAWYLADSPTYRLLQRSSLVLAHK